jgi:hypothetical protein
MWIIREWQTGLKIANKKVVFKMETLNIQTIFARKSVTNTTKHYPKT